MDNLIRYLESISSDDRKRDNAALAALRRGLGTLPGTCVEMYPYVLPRLNEEQQKYHFPVYCLVASLFALHPSSTPEGNMGNHLRRAAGDNIEATERRFTNLLRAHPDDLHIHLRQIVSFLKSKGVEVNWQQLLRDLVYWDNENMSVQKTWAQGFWGYLKQEEKETEDDSDIDNSDEEK